MKKIVVNIMSTTGLSLVILALIGIFSGAKFLCLDSVFQLFGANVAIHLGLILTNKFESKYLILESFLDISYTIGIVLAFGFAFNWYLYIPVWILVIMAVVVYLIGCAISIFRLREDVKIVNELLQNRNRQVQ
ncbi:MAG: hypothetical protein PHY47_16450 [Lachnospiraceae bacterium]|nr:hypothetical protein [Lachnospiraceae bacterium]